MEKFIRITYNEKAYKIILDENILGELAKLTNPSMIFDENGYVVRYGKTPAETFQINDQIEKAIMMAIEKFPLNAKEKQRIKEVYENGYVTFKNRGKIEAHLKCSAVDSLAIEYDSLRRNYQLDTKKDNEASVKQGVEEKENDDDIKPNVASSVLHGQELTDRILNSSTNAFENKEIARAVLLRASDNPKLSKYFNKNEIESAINNIIICKDEQEFKERYKNLNAGMDSESLERKVKIVAGFYYKGKIVLPPTTVLSVIVHELMHLLSGAGIKEIAGELIKEKLDWQGISLGEIRSLDEAFTEAITRIVLPEIKASCTYDVGAKFISKLYFLCEKYNKSPERIFDAYFKKDKYALESIENDFNNISLSKIKIIPKSGINENVWKIILKSITNEEQFLIYDSVILGTVDLEKVLDSLEDSYYRYKYGTSRVETFYGIRKEYGLREQKKIGENSEVEYNGEYPQSRKGM